MPKNVVARLSAFAVGAFAFLLGPFVQSKAGALIPVSMYVVDRLTDTNPSGGGEGVGLAGVLRYAISNTMSADTITFIVSGTVNLSAVLPNLDRDIRDRGE